MLKRTDYINQIKPLINNKIIKVLTGMRRSGKSTLLLLIQEELIKSGIDEKQIISINLELLKYKKYNDYQKLYEYIETKITNKDRYYIFLDEIQEVANFEIAINSLVNEFDVDIFITGSNSNLLSGELATHLTGRYVNFEIMPLSVKEICADLATINDNDFINYMKHGGLPSIYNLDESIKLNYLNDLWNSIILKDIVKRFSIRDIDLFERFMQFLLHNIGQIFSADNVVNYLKNEGRKLSKETIYNYIHYCESAFLIHRIPRYNVKGKELLKTLEKYYVNDIGFRSLYFNNQADIGQVIENIVCLELLRRHYTLRVGKIGDKEIDFVAIKNNTVIYIQVCYLLANESIVEREFNPLLSISDNYPKYVISMDKVNMSKDGINHLNIIDFLIKDEI